MPTTNDSTLHNDDLTTPYDPADDDNIDDVTPLPKFQLLIVFLVQFAEPVTGTVIYPFVNQFVRSTGITNGDERKTGYYAGIIASAFFFAESFTVVQWGYMADRYGRRPILLFGPLGLALAMFAFGVSTTFWPLVFWRCIQGIFNGNIGVSKSVIAEVTDSTNVADAYAMIPFMWSSGTTLGPILGGILSDPAKRWPDSFGRISYLRAHPYLLPCAVASLISAVTFIIALFGLKETLPSLVSHRQFEKHKAYPTDEPSKADATTRSSLLDCGEGLSYGAVSLPRNGSESELSESQSSTCSSPIEPRNPQDLTIRSLILGPLKVVLLNYLFLAFLDMSHGVLLPLMYSTSISLGGLGLDPFRIGAALGLFGAFNSVVQMVLLGRLIRRFGARRMYIVSFSSIIICFLMYPVLNYLARRAGGISGSVVVGMVIQLGFQTMGYAAYGAVQVLIVQSVPEGGPMATVNGVAQMVGSGMRSIAPTFASSLFSISLTRQLAGGNLVYFVLIAMTLVGIRLSLLLPTAPKKRRRKTSSGRGSPSIPPHPSA